MRSSNRTERRFGRRGPVAFPVAGVLVLLTLTILTMGPSLALARKSGQGPAYYWGGHPEYERIVIVFPVEPVLSEVRSSGRMLHFSMPPGMDDLRAEREARSFAGARFIEDVLQRDGEVVILLRRNGLTHTAFYLPDSRKLVIDVAPEEKAGILRIPRSGTALPFDGRTSGQETGAEEKNGTGSPKADNGTQPAASVSQDRASGVEPSGVEPSGTQGPSSSAMNKTEEVHGQEGSGNRTEAVSETEPSYQVTGAVERVGPEEARVYRPLEKEVPAGEGTEDK